MKIAVWHNLPPGGGKRALYYYARGLAERGHKLEFWSPSSANRDYCSLAPFGKEHVSSLNWSEGRKAKGLRRLRFENWDRPTMVRAIDQTCQEAASQINQGNFDILFAHPCQFLGAAQIARYVDLPSSLYLQEPHRPLYEARHGSPWGATEYGGNWWNSPTKVREAIRDLGHLYGMRYQVREEIISARAYDQILVNSYFSRENVLRAYGLNSSVCYLGIDTDLFENRKLERERFIVGLGMMTPNKNIKFVIQAIAYLKDPRPPLVWIGSISNLEYVQELTALALKLGVEFQPVTMASDEEVIDTLNRAWVMAYAPRLEPFGYAPLEANSCGLPVVAVAEGGVRESIVSEQGGIFVDGRPEAMAEGLQRLLDNPLLTKELGENGERISVEKWCLAKALDRLESHFKLLDIN